MKILGRGPGRRRADARVAYVDAVQAVRLASGSDSEEPLGDVTSRDISPGGMRLRTTSSVSPGNWIAVSFSYGGHTYLVMGQVAWAAPSGGGCVEFGIRFESLAPALKDRLALERLLNVLAMPSIA